MKRWKVSQGWQVRLGHGRHVFYDDFRWPVAIVHIIAIGAKKVSFQMRGLEYIQQTLCHGETSAILRKIISEHKNLEI